MTRSVNRHRHQFLGEGKALQYNTGTLYPAITGGHISLLAVELMADEGGAWPIEGTGKILGMYIIDECRPRTPSF